MHLTSIFQSVKIKPMSILMTTYHLDDGHFNPTVEEPPTIDAQACAIQVRYPFLFFCLSERTVLTGGVGATNHIGA